MHNLLATQDTINRRIFLRRSAAGIGMAALASLMGENALAGSTELPRNPVGGLIGYPTRAPRAKRVIYLLQSGGPSQFELFDEKPALRKLSGTDLRKIPNTLKEQRLTGMTSGQATLPIAPSIFDFSNRGKSGIRMGNLIPHMGSMADEMCVLKAVFTEQINHDPAITFLQTGSQLAGRPSIGAWVTYGLGSVNKDLPSYVVLTSAGTGRRDCQPIAERQWGAGFLPTKYQGVRLRAGKDPVLYIGDPPGVDRSMRRRMLDQVTELDRQELDAVGDPEIATRVSQYELAFRMQTSVPELTEISNEPRHVMDAYGPDVNKPGTYARNCLLARRMAERGVRFIQLFHRGWDHHFNLPNALKGQINDTDQASAALLKDLKERGMLDDTLVVWGGEFGRTVYSQGTLTNTDYGRDHHPRCYSIWMAGGGIKGGMSFGETDDFSYNIVKDGVHVHDLNATIMALLGIDHERLTYKYQGRPFRLTDVHGRVVNEILA